MIYPCVKEQLPKHSELAVRAHDFAKAAHESIGQVRKYSGEPYFVHPSEVADLVANVGGDSAMIAAAYLHDTVEDTPVTLDQIEATFGSDVASLVEQLTDVSRPEDGNRRARKAIDLAHTAKASPRAQTIKLADLISNSKSIGERDPEFATTYFREKMQLLNVLKDGHKTLWVLAANQVSAV
jgi:(p)ppGpp synthase/HD superfamily hydrolase